MGDSEVPERLKEYLSWIEEHGSRPQKSSKEEAERRLANWSRDWLYPSGKNYKRELEIMVKHLVASKPHPNKVRGDKTKEEIIDFLRKHGHFPSARRPDSSEEEKRLGIALSNYVDRTGTSYSPAFRKEVIALGYASRLRRHDGPMEGEGCRLED